jgi:hypothetical protein
MRTRQSTERAIAAGATSAERLVLAAVHHWLATFSWFASPVTLGQIAQVAGLWDGAASDCPREITKKVAQRLRQLEEYDALRYRAGGARGAGDASWVALPKLVEGPMLDFRGGSIEQRQTREAGPTGPPHKGGQQSTRSGADRAPEAGPTGPPRRGDREDRGASAIAQRLKAQVETHRPCDLAEARSVVDAFLDYVDIEELDRFVRELPSIGHVTHPRQLFSAWEVCNGEAPWLDAAQNRELASAPVIELDARRTR